jgi:hypothetical protein
VREKSIDFQTGWDDGVTVVTRRHVSPANHTTFLSRFSGNDKNWHGMCVLCLMPGMQRFRVAVSGWLNHEHHGLRDKI